MRSQPPPAPPLAAIPAVAPSRRICGASTITSPPEPRRCADGATNDVSQTEPRQTFPFCVDEHWHLCRRSSPRSSSRSPRIAAKSTASAPRSASILFHEQTLAEGRSAARSRAGPHDRARAAGALIPQRLAQRARCRSICTRCRIARSRSSAPGWRRLNHPTSSSKSSVSRSVQGARTRASNSAGGNGQFSHASSSARSSGVIRRGSELMAGRLAIAPTSVCHRRRGGERQTAWCGSGRRYKAMRWSRLL